jgi:hypothetical protein
LALNTLQIEWHFKYLESKENKSDGHIDICSKNKEHCCNYVIEKKSIEHITNTSTNISSPNKIHEKNHVQFKRQERNNNNQKKVLSTENVSFFLFNNEKNIFFINAFLNIKKIKDIARHICYCCQRLHFKYQFFVALNSYIEIPPHELKKCNTYARCINM